MNQTITITIADVDVDVEIDDVTVTNDPGVWRDANGDGCPPSSEIKYNFCRNTVREAVKKAFGELAVDPPGATDAELDAMIESAIEQSVNDADWAEWEEDDHPDPDLYPDDE